MEGNIHFKDLGYFVLKICDSAILMRNGEILDSGNPEDIVNMLTSEEKEDMLINVLIDC